MGSCWLRVADRQSGQISAEDPNWHWLMVIDDIIVGTRCRIKFRGCFASRDSGMGYVHTEGKTQPKTLWIKFSRSTFAMKIWNLNFFIDWMKIWGVFCKKSNMRIISGVICVLCVWITRRNPKTAPSAAYSNRKPKKLGAFTSEPLGDGNFSPPTYLFGIAFAWEMNRSIILMMVFLSIKEEPDWRPRRTGRAAI